MDIQIKHETSFEVKVNMLIQHPEYGLGLVYNKLSPLKRGERFNVFYFNTDLPEVQKCIPTYVKDMLPFQGTIRLTQK